jgi:hypothetical protein
LPTSHEEPATSGEAYDNVTLTLESIQALFSVIHDANQDTHTGSVAYLGESLCEELHRRVDVFYEMAKGAPREEG